MDERRTSEAVLLHLLAAEEGTDAPGGQDGDVDAPGGQEGGVDAPAEREGTAGTGGGPGAGTDPLSRSLPGIWAGLGIPGAATGERAAVVEALRDLRSRGDLRRSTGRVPGLPGERAVYRLTESGRARARDCRERVADEAVRLPGAGSGEELRLGDLGDHLDPEPGPPIPATGPASAGSDGGKGRWGPPSDAVAVDPLAWGVANLDDGTLRDGPRRGGEAFVDRGAERGRLEATLDAAAGGTGRTVLVTGGAGVGKSALVDAAASLARERGFAVGVAGATAGDPPYAPVLRACAGVLDAEDLAAAVDRHAGLSVTYLEDLLSRRGALADALADRLRERADEVPLFLAVDDLGRASDSTLALFRSLADRLADAPVVLLGVHGGGTSQGEGGPVVTRDDGTGTAGTGSGTGAGAGTGPVAGTGSGGGIGSGAGAGTGSSPGEVAGTASPADLDADARIALDPLDGPGVTGVVGRVLGSDDPPTAVVERVADRSGGNPTLAVGFARALVEAGEVDPAGEGPPEHRGADPDGDDGTLPEGVEALVGRRIDGLPAGAREVLETAAVLGGTLRVEDLLAALEAPESEAREWLDLLVGAGLLDPVPDAPGETVRFAGGPVRTVALSGVEDDRQGEIHRRVAAALAGGDGGTGRSGSGDEWLADAGTGPDWTAAVAAHHHEAAGDADRALDRYRAAAGWARERYAHEDAARYLESATDLAREVGDDGALVDSLAALGEVRAALGEFDEALRHLAYVRERADGARRVRAYRVASEVHHGKGDFDAAVDLADRGLEAVAAHRSDPGSGPGSGRGSRTGPGHGSGGGSGVGAGRGTGSGSGPGSIDVRGGVRDGPGGDPPTAVEAERVRLLIRKGVSLLERDDPDAARETFERALDRLSGLSVPADGASGSPERGDPQGASGEAPGMSGEAPGTSEETTGASGEAPGADPAEWGDGSLADRGRGTIAGLRGEALNRLGTARLYLGDATGAVDALTEAVEAFPAGDPDRAMPLLNLGIVHRQLGDPEAAAERLATAREALADGGDPAMLAEVLQDQGRTREAAGETAAAAERYAEALAVAESVDAHLAVASVATDLGAAHQSLGEFEAARERLDRAVAVAEQVGDDATLATAHNARSQLAAQAGDPDGAREHAEAALSAARETGDPATVAYALGQVGERAREDGDHDRAVECHEEAVETAAAVGAGTVAAFGRIGLARDHLATGDHETALAHADAADERIDDPAGSPSLWVAVERIRADCERQRGDLAAAEDRLAAAGERLADDRLPLRAQLLVDRAELAAERGEDDRARELARDGRGLAHRVGLDPVAERAGDLLGGD